MKNVLVGIAAFLAFAMLGVASAKAAESTFERDLGVAGRVDLAVRTGAGSIHLTVGPSGHVHVFGRVRSSWGANDDEVREIADHPPIEQTGNIVRIGETDQNLHNISIEYEVQAPANSFLNAATGSGSIEDDGVGADAKLSTGSGSIRATGLNGSFTVGTGSGGIYAEQAGAGDVKATTGSGPIELKDLRGGLYAHTGSGSIKAGGTPTAPWRLDTGSGGIELWTGGAQITLDAATGSGGIHSDREVATEGTFGRHHLKGNIGGGGPTVRVRTGSGGIHIH